MRKIILALIGISMIAAGCNKSVLAQDRTLQIKQFKLTVQLADTPAKRSAGLSGVSAITESEGMLFLFSEPQQSQFWMKGMRIPIDIIWINGEKIVGISDNAKVEPNVSDDMLARYAPPSPADKVLEVNAGWAFRHDINVGDLVKDISPKQP